MPRTPAALITAGSSGVGLAIAHRLAASGFDMTISARNLFAASRAAESLRMHGGVVQPVAVDELREEDVRELAAAHVDCFGALDTLVLASELSWPGPLDTYSSRRWDVMHKVNVLAPLILIQQLLPALRRAGAEPAGHGALIVAVSSSSQPSSDVHLASYRATKAALASLCESISNDELSNGIKAVTLSRQTIHSPTRRRAGEAPAARLRRREDVAAAVYALCTESRVTRLPDAAASTA